MKKEIVGYEYCTECRAALRKWTDQLIGLCRKCYLEHFPPRKSRGPALKGWARGKRQRLLSAREIAKSRRWIDKIIERVDKEAKNLTKPKGAGLGENINRVPYNPSACQSRLKRERQADYIMRGGD